MKETIQSIIDWHTKTFPDETLEGQIKKFEEELAEYKAEKNLLELADMFIVACGIARFDPVIALKYFAQINSKSPVWERLGAWGAFKFVIDEKMEKNRKRVWAKTGEGQYHHENGIED